MKNQQQVDAEMIERLLDGAVICDIGQVNIATARKMDVLVRKGEAIKWRGYWHPCAGANFGIGPLKTCWGVPDYLQSPSVQNLSAMNVHRREAQS